MLFLFFPAACTTLARWKRDDGQSEGLLQRSLRAAPARGTPVSHGQVLDAARARRRRWYLRPRRTPDAAGRHGRGDTALPRAGLPGARSLGITYGQGDPAYRLSVVGEDGGALPPRLRRYPWRLPRRPGGRIRREPRGRDAPRFLWQRRGLLRLQRLRHRRAGRPGRGPRGAGGRYRHRRAPGERYSADIAGGRYGVHVLDPRREEFPLPQGGERPRRAPPRRR